MINDPTNIIHEALMGLTLQHPSLSHELEHKIIYHRPGQFRDKSMTAIGFAGGGKKGNPVPLFLNPYPFRIHPYPL